MSALVCCDLLYPFFRFEMIKERNWRKRNLRKEKKRWPYKGNSPTIIPSPPLLLALSRDDGICYPSNLQSLLLSESRWDFKFLTISTSMPFQGKRFDRFSWPLSLSPSPLSTPLDVQDVWLSISRNHPRRISSSEPKCGKNVQFRNTSDWKEWETFLFHARVAIGLSDNKRRILLSLDHQMVPTNFIHLLRTRYPKA